VCTAGDRLDESAGIAHVEPVTKDEETAPAMFNGAEGLAFWVDMLMVSHLYLHPGFSAHPCACVASLAYSP
jgi:hypothetical protein